MIYYTMITCLRYAFKLSCSFLLAVLISSSVLHAQVLNLDREVTADSLKKKYSFAGTFFLSSDKQKNNLIDVSGNLEFNRIFNNRYVLISLFRSDAVFNGDQMIQNEGMCHLRYRDNDHRKLSTEFYAQYQWNGAWGMIFRNLYGSNLRIKIFEKDHRDLYGGIGGFYEIERWDWRGVKSELIPLEAKNIMREMWRMNTYLKASAKLSKNIDISATSYLQFPLNEQFFMPRWYMETNLFINATGNLSFVLHWDHLRDLNRVVPIDDFFYTFSMGIQLTM